MPSWVNVVYTQYLRLLLFNLISNIDEVDLSARSAGIEHLRLNTKCEIWGKIFEFCTWDTNSGEAGQPSLTMFVAFICMSIATRLYIVFTQEINHSKNPRCLMEEGQTKFKVQAYFTMGMFFFKLFDLKSTGLEHFFRLNTKVENERCSLLDYVLGTLLRDEAPG